MHDSTELNRVPTRSCMRLSTATTSDWAENAVRTVLAA
jgi:hypothetical protein